MPRGTGLILKDPERQLEGITLAAILLFGKDSTIPSVLPQHKTDAIFRVENVDRITAERRCARPFLTVIPCKKRYRL